MWSFVFWFLFCLITTERVWETTKRRFENEETEESGVNKAGMNEEKFFFFLTPCRCWCFLSCLLWAVCERCGRISSCVRGATVLWVTLRAVAILGQGYRRDRLISCPCVACTVVGLGGCCWGPVSFHFSGTIIKCMLASLSDPTVPSHYAWGFLFFFISQSVLYTCLQSMMGGFIMCSFFFFFLSYMLSSVRPKWVGLH